MKQQLEQKMTGAEISRQLALQINCEAFLSAFGVERCAFQTMTSARQHKDWHLLQKDYHSFTTGTGALSGRYAAAITVFEPHKSGAWHVHRVIALDFDCRTGFDFDAYLCARQAVGRQARYHWTEIYGRSACPALRAEWKFLRERGPAYGFNRIETVPIRTGGWQVGKYLAGYLGKEVPACVGVRCPLPVSVASHLANFHASMLGLKPFA